MLCSTQWRLDAVCSLVHLRLQLQAIFYVTPQNDQTLKRSRRNFERLSMARPAPFVLENVHGIARVRD